MLIHAGISEYTQKHTHVNCEAHCEKSNLWEEENEGEEEEEEGDASAGLLLLHGNNGNPHQREGDVKY